MSGNYLSEIDPNWANMAIHEISGRLLDSNKVPHRALTAGLISCSTPAVGVTTRRKTLLEYVLVAYTLKLAKTHNINFLGSHIIDSPLKNSNIYEHNFATKDGNRFYAYQFGIYPTSSIDHLALAILERKSTKGCIACSFKGFTEEDVECYICRNGAVRNLITQNSKAKPFRDHGWHILSEVFGEHHTKILDAFADEYQSFYSDIYGYMKNRSEIVEEYKKTEEYGTFFGEEIENTICFSPEDYEDEYEVDDADDDSDD